MKKIINLPKIIEVLGSKNSINYKLAIITCRCGLSISGATRLINRFEKRYIGNKNDGFGVK